MAGMAGLLNRVLQRGPVPRPCDDEELVQLRKRHAMTVTRADAALKVLAKSIETDCPKAPVGM